MSIGTVNLSGIQESTNNQSGMSTRIVGRSHSFTVSMPPSPTLVRTSTSTKIVKTSKGVFQSLSSKDGSVSITEKEGKTTISSGRSSLTRTVSGGQHVREVSVRFQWDKTLKLPLSPIPTAVRLPENSEQQIRDWKNNRETWINKPEIDVDKEKKRQDKLKERVGYEDKDILPALNKFRDDYHCHWHEMVKAVPGVDSKVLQIINDFRALEVAKHLEVVKLKCAQLGFPIKDIKDFGSTKPTSDKDFSIEIGSGNQTEEAKAVRFFNEEFEKALGCSSASMFDTNVYTSQYLLTATDPKREKDRILMQTQASLWMMLRTSGTDSWNEFKSATLEKLPTEELQKVQRGLFEQVEKENKKLEFLLSQEIARRALSKDAVPEETREAIEKILTKDFTEAYPGEIQALKDLAETIKESHADSKIQASNSLHEKFKSGFALMENKRKKILKDLQDLSQCANGPAFVTKYNASIDRLRKDLGSPEEWTRLSEAKIPPSLSPQEPADLFKAFKAKEKYNSDLRKLNEKNTGLETLYTLVDELNKLKNKDTSQFDEKEIEFEKISELKKEIYELCKKYDVNFNSHEFSIASLKDMLRKARQDIQQHIEGFSILQNTFGKKLILISFLDNESDDLLIKMQKENITGMQCAQEAHVGEGAQSTVIRAIQAKEKTVRSLAQYTGALHEISGFLTDHQLHESDFSSKIIEGSTKYADRLNIVSHFLLVKADILGLPPPALKDLEALSAFFSKLVPIRGTGKSPEELVEAIRVAANLESVKFDYKDEKDLLEKLNSMILSLVSTWTAWKIINKQ